MRSSGSKRQRHWWGGRDPAAEEAEAKVLCFYRTAAGDGSERLLWLRLDSDSADLGEAVLKEIDLEIRLLLKGSAPVETAAFGNFGAHGRSSKEKKKKKKRKILEGFLTYLIGSLPDRRG
ncbi:hypothetical protein BHE74_00035383 [Ensete ventricosum]|nr:hypothetical protein BHE74_00035383 [Ensete ventricosum]RZR99061.1 hypothetical protein BHM03_00028550 [Ensete ventricosum]